MRALSPELQNGWIERVFARLGALYGSEFTGKWLSIKPEMVKETWLAALGPYNGEHIAHALSACANIRKAPNCPEFAELCRQAWETRREAEREQLSAKLSQAENARFASQMKAAAAKLPRGRRWMVSGVEIEPDKIWAVKMLQRVQNGEQLSAYQTDCVRAALPFLAGLEGIEITYTDPEEQEVAT